MQKLTPPLQARPGALNASRASSAIPYLARLISSTSSLPSSSPALVHLLPGRSSDATSSSLGKFAVPQSVTSPAGGKTVDDVNASLCLVQAFSFSSFCCIMVQDRWYRGRAEFCYGQASPRWEVRPLGDSPTTRTRHNTSRSGHEYITHDLR